jgi:hypothetical protein
MSLNVRYLVSPTRQEKNKTFKLLYEVLFPNKMTSHPWRFIEIKCSSTIFKLQNRADFFTFHLQKHHYCTIKSTKLQHSISFHHYRNKAASSHVV